MALRSGRRERTGRRGPLKPAEPVAARTSWLPLMIALVAVSGLKIAVVFQLKDHVLLQPSSTIDTAAYVNLATRVIQGDVSLGPGLYYVSPLYIYFLAAILWLTHSLTVVRVVQVVLGVVTVASVFAMARQWSGQRAAYLAAGAAAATGLFTFYEVVLLQAALDPFLTAAGLLALTLALRRQDWRWAVASGVAFGVLALNRPNALAAVAAPILALAVTRRTKTAVVLAAGVALGLSPVIARNIVVSRQFALVSSHGGLNLLIGNGDGATGLFRAIPGVRPTIEGQQVDTRTVAERALGRPLTDGEVSSYFAGLAWTWIRNHPAEWAGLLFKKAYYTLHAQHIALPLSYPFFAYDARTLLRVLVVGPWLLVPMGLFGLVVLMRAPTTARADYLVWCSFVPAYVVSVTVFFVSERYRLPLLVPLAVGTGAAIDRILTALRVRDTRWLLRSGAVLAALAVAVNWPLGFVDGDARAEEQVHMAENEAHAGRVDSAEYWIARALAEYPYPAVAEYRVGVQLLNVRQWEAAVRHLSEAVRLAPADTRARVDLAAAFAGAGDSGQAKQALAAIAPSTDAGADLWLRAGRLAMDLDVPATAEPFFANAVRQQPESPSVRDQHGFALLVLRRFDEAAAAFSAALRVDGRRPDSLAGLSYCDLQLGRWDDARTHAEAALAADPKQPLAGQVRALLAHRK